MTKDHTPNIYLIGFRCTGKTSVGKILSSLLERPFVDTDQVIQEEKDQSVFEMVEQHDWEYFRCIENKIFQRISKTQGCIVSTGGGIVLDSANRVLLKTTGRTIWLSAEEKVILERITSDPSTAVSRPGLTQKDLGTEIHEMMAARMAFYQESAEFMIDTSVHSPDHIAHMILRRLSHDRV